jgi:two-component system sensor histidine kinase UhpB
MPLRLRIILVIGLVLLLAMTLGTLVAGYEVRRALSAELSAGMSGAHQTAVGAFEDLPQSDHPARDLRELVATFDGNRHIRATLLGADGKVFAFSSTRQADTPPPGWFRALLKVTPSGMALPLPPTRFGAGRLVLTPTPDLDVSATWNEFLALMGVLVVTAMAGLLMVYMVITAAFRPLTVLAQRFAGLGGGTMPGAWPKRARRSCGICSAASTGWRARWKPPAPATANWPSNWPIFRRKSAPISPAICMTRSGLISSPSASMPR